MISGGIWRQGLKALFVNKSAWEATPFEHNSMTLDTISNINEHYGEF